VQRTLAVNALAGDPMNVKTSALDAGGTVTVCASGLTSVVTVHVMGTLQPFAMCTM
jgi:hypothetical protein